MSLLRGNAVVSGAVWERLKSDAIVRVATFVAAISVAAEQVSALNARLATLANVSGMKAIQVGKLPFSIVQMMTHSRVLAKYCHAKDGATSSRRTITTLSLLETARRLAALGVGVSTSGGVWSRATRWLQITSLAPAVTSGIATAERADRKMWRSVTDSNGFSSTAKLPVKVVPALAQESMHAGLRADAASVMWSSWSPILDALRASGTAVHDELITFIGKVVSGMESASSDSGTRVYEKPVSPGGAGGRPATLSAMSRVRAIPPALLNSVAPIATQAATCGFVSLNPSDSQIDFQRSHLTLREVAAITVRNAPLLAAPSMVAIPSARRQADTVSEPSLVINSAPTVVINSNQPLDIEHRVLEALRQHREALFDQWQRGLQRRQRTEF
jgi:hypothetical protein